MNARAATPASLVLSAVVVLAAGCSGDGVREVSATTSSSDSAPASFQVEEMGQFDDPWAMAFLPGGDLLVTERTGTLNLRDADTGDSVEVGGVPDVAAEGQGGLGDVVLAPTFAEDQMVYLSWVEEGEGGSGAVVGRATLETGDEPTLEGLEVIWRQAPKVSGTGHFSHRIAFDPEGEHLFVSSGDRQKKTPAQDTSNSLGTIMRMGLDGSSPQIWSYGHRNPLGLEFAPDGNLWSSEMGPEGGDELNLIEQDANYGWPEVSNGSDYGGGEIPDHAPGDGFVAPEAFWTPSISPGSLLIYSGDLFPEWEGDALIGALSGEALVHVDLDGTTAGETQTFEMGERIRAVEQGPDGAIWLLEDGGSGQLLKLTPEAS
ncbi:PQQ-dependent sugar dehydrogenase [Aeromicrobium sp. CF3.5]|uniref:PQQ-dependent sugar dehydrogenase n=1 Tax=Aeromicrobium sp. CF3.5 TaxID=3373078 RepID=UPI003EE7A88D